MRFLVFITGRNCEQYAKECLESLINQTYTNWKAFIFSDGSTDKTANIINDVIKDEKLKGKTSFWALGEQNTNVKNLFTSIMHNAAWGNERGIIVWLDLDDKLLPNALETVAKVYEEHPETWMTYGNYITNTGEQPFDETNIEIPDHIHQSNAYRKHPFMFMHLRTFRNGLLFQLTNKDLIPGDEIYPDANLWYCLMEMSGKEHMKAITEPLYVYNKSNPINVERVYSQSQRHKELQTICNRKPKQRLSTLY